MAESTRINRQNFLRSRLWRSRNLKTVSFSGLLGRNSSHQSPNFFARAFGSRGIKNRIIFGSTWQKFVAQIAKFSSLAPSALAEFENRIIFGSIWQKFVASIAKFSSLETSALAEIKTVSFSGLLGRNSSHQSQNFFAREFGARGIKNRIVFGSTWQKFVASIAKFSSREPSALAEIKTASFSGLLAEIRCTNCQIFFARAFGARGI